jgi:hypothetical protein
MATKPSINKPDWANSEPIGANVTEPTARKTTGYVTAGGIPEKPTYQELNFLFKSITEWVAYFEQLTDEEKVVNDAQIQNLLENTEFLKQGFSPGFLPSTSGKEFQPTDNGNANEIDINDSTVALFYGSDDSIYRSTNGTNTVVTLTASDGSNDRYDLISLDASAGTYTVTTGTPAAFPTKPAIPAGEDGICYVLRIATIDIPTANEIEDIRVACKSKLPEEGHYKNNFSIDQREDTENQEYDNQIMFQRHDFGTKFDRVNQMKSRLMAIEHITVSPMSDAEVTRVGAWNHTGDRHTDYFFGRRVNTSTAGDYMIFKFTGVSCTFGTWHFSSTYGRIRISLSDDGGATFKNERIITNLGSTQLGSTVYAYSNLEYGDYQLKVESVDNDNVSITMFGYTTYMVQRPATQYAPTTGGASTIDDVPPLTLLHNETGLLNYLGSPNSWNSVGVDTASATFTSEFKFYGSKVWLCFTPFNYGGSIGVEIDGSTDKVSVTSFDNDLFHADTGGNTEKNVWIRLDDGTLNEGIHTVKLSKLDGGSFTYGGFGYYSADENVETTLKRHLICGKDSYTKSIVESGFTFTGSWVDTSSNQGGSYLQKRAYTLTANDYVTVTTPNNPELKAIYIICEESNITEAAEIKISLGGASSNVRYLDLKANDYAQPGQILLCYDKFMDDVDLHNKELRITHNDVNGKLFAIEGVIFEIGDPVEDSYINCMPKWQRFNSSGSHIACPVTTALRVDVYGDKTDTKEGRLPSIHSGWIWKSGNAYMNSGLGLSVNDVDVSVIRNNHNIPANATGSVQTGVETALIAESLIPGVTRFNDTDPVGRFFKMYIQPNHVV